MVAAKNGRVMPPKRQDNSAQAPISRRTTRAALSAAQQADEPQSIVSSDVANTTLPVSQTNIEETIRSTLNSLLPSILPSILAESNRNTAPLNNDQINSAPQITVPQTSSPQITFPQTTAPQIHVELPSAPSITLRPFNGNGDIVEFLNEFKSASIIYKWSPERQLELMNAYLTEGASEFYKSLSPLEKLNIEMVYNKLIKRYINKSAYLAKFNSIRPEDGETPREFANKLHQYLNRAMPSCDGEEKFGLLKSRLINSLPSSIVNNFKPIEDLITWDNLIISVERVLPKFGVDQSFYEPSGIDINRITTTPATVTNIRSRSSSNNRRSFSRNRNISRTRCYNCFGFGHLAKDCPSPVSEQRQSQPRQFDTRARQSPKQFDSKTKYSRVNTIRHNNKNGLYRIRVGYEFPNNRSQTITTLIDTGATNSIINYRSLSNKLKQLINEFIDDPERHNELRMRQSKIRFEGAFGKPFEEICPVIDLKIRIGNWRGWHSFIISKRLGKESAILGSDFLNNHNYAKVDNSFKIFYNGELNKQTTAYSSETVIIPPNSEMIVDANTIRSKAFANREMCIEPFDHSQKGLVIAKSLNRVVNGQVQLSVLNYSESSVKLHKGEALGMLYEPDKIFDDADINAVVNSTRSETLSDEVLNKFSMNKELSAEQRQKLLSLLNKYADVISKNSQDLGRTNVIEHRIDTGDHSPIKSAPYHAPQTTKDKIDEMVQEMMDNDVIEESFSPWSSPIILVKKKDGSFRFCVDFRKLNSITRKDAYPLPRVDDVIDVLVGSKYFTTIDTVSGFWQVGMSEKDKEKTAFTTPRGLYQFKVMPFGLSNAPGTFQRLMDKVLKGLNWKKCVVYLDDIIIFSKTFEEHLIRLEQVLLRLRSANLKIQPSKCHFANHEVNFLGFKVTKDGLRPNQERVEAISHLPPPTNVTETRRFLGFVSYYRRFIKNLSTVAKPLFDLCTKKSKFNWTPECQHSFDKLKDLLCTSPILRYADPSKDFVLQCDASGTAIGAVISQCDGNDVEHPIAYASRTLSPAERRYSNSEREALAILWASSYFRHYLYGKNCKIFTDHKALVSINRMKNPEGRLSDILSKLQNIGINHTILYRRAMDNSNADFLSRINSIQISAFDWVKEQSVDPNLKQIIDQAVTQPLVKFNDFYLNEAGVLVQNIAGEEKIVVPEHLRSEVCRLGHDHPLAGHMNAARTVKRICKTFFWPNMNRDIHDHVKCCFVCQTCKLNGKAPKAPLKSIHSTSPWKDVQLDFEGPFSCSKKGNYYILVATDLFSRWCIALATKTNDAETVARFIFKEICCQHGTPHRIIMDRGSHFENQVIDSLCKLLRIDKAHSTPYHPMAQGGVERQNRTIKQMLRCYVQDQPEEWDEFLPQLIFAYNTMEHSSTRVSPFEVLRGLKPDLAWEHQVPSGNLQGYVAKLCRNQAIVHEVVRKNSVLVKQRQEKQYNKTTCQKYTYKQGDLVLVRFFKPIAGQSKSFNPKFVGPFEVVKVNSEQNLTIKDNTGKNHKVHYNNVKPFHQTATTDTELAQIRNRGRPKRATQPAQPNRPEQAQTSRQPAPVTRPVQAQVKQPMQGNRRASHRQPSPSSRFNQPGKRKPGRPSLQVTIPNASEQTTRKVVNRKKVQKKRVTQSKSNTSYNLRPKANMSLVTRLEQPDQMDTISLYCDPTDL